MENEDRNSGQKELRDAMKPRRKKPKEEKNPSREFIQMVCDIYGDKYDDREEDSALGGLDWRPGQRALHKSIARFQKELKEYHWVELSKVKIQKILITGGCWTTERSREVQLLYETYTEREKDTLRPEEAIEQIAEELEISKASVNMNLPYRKVVYDLAEKSADAVRMEGYRERKENGMGGEKLRRFTDLNDPEGGPVEDRGTWDWVRNKAKESYGSGKKPDLRETPVKYSAQSRREEKDALKKEQKLFMRQMGQQLLKTREAHGLSQQELGDMMGVGRKRIGNIENGLLDLRTSELCLISEKLQCSLLDLLPSAWLADQPPAFSPEIQDAIQRLINVLKASQFS